MKTVKIRSTEVDDFVLPTGWYGLVSAASTGIIHRTGIERQDGMEAIERLCSPDPDSRTPDYDGRRMVRVDGGFIVLNFDKYRQKDHTGAERARRYRARKSSDTYVTRDVTTKRVTGRCVTQAEAEAEAEISEAKASSSAQPTARVESGGVVDSFHALCPSLPKVRDLTDARKAAVRSRWKASSGRNLDWFKELFIATEASDFLTGRNGEWSGCSFDWLLKPANAQKVLEGNYANDRRKTPGKNGHAKPAAPNIRDGIDEEKFIAWYYATYPPTVKPGMTLLTASVTVIQKYREEND